MCREYIDIIASNIPQIKIIAASQWTARFNIQRKPKKWWCLLINLSFGLFDHKKNPALFQNFSKIPGISRTLFKFQDFPGLSRTFQDWWEPCDFKLYLFCSVLFLETYFSYLVKVKMFFFCYWISSSVWIKQGKLTQLIIALKNVWHYKKKQIVQNIVQKV